MAFEIELLALGNADSIIIRYISESNHEWVVLIDAGNKGDGEKIESYIKKYTNQKYIDLAVCTHPDNDHIGGFFYLLNNVDIKKFWIHDPSQHIDLAAVKNTISTATLYRKMNIITESIDNSTNLLTQIDKKGIKREEPFSELSHPIIPIKVLGPSKPFYEELLKGFRDINSLIKEEAFYDDFAVQEISETESLSDTLDSDDDKSCENNTSAIIAFYPENEIFLFTGDAGVIALDNMLSRYSKLENIYCLKVPHHGSKYNLSSKIINKLSPTYSVISASGTRKYPSRAVVNALKKVNSNVYSTQNNTTLLFQSNMPSRDNYSNADSL